MKTTPEQLRTWADNEYPGAVTTSDLPTTTVEQTLAPYNFHIAGPLNGVLTITLRD